MLTERTREFIRNVRQQFSAKEFTGTSSGDDESGGSRQLPDWHMQELINGSGWDVLGSGAYGIALGNPSKNYIIKLFSKEDTSYISWVNFCIQNQHNPYVPKIRGKIVPINNDILAIRVERLVFMYKLAEKFMDSIKVFDKTKHFTNEFAHDPNAHRTDFIKAWAFISKNAYSFCDLHGDNVGFRYDPTSPHEFQPVLLDPIGPSLRPPQQHKAFVNWLSHRFRKR